MPNKSKKRVIKKKKKTLKSNPLKVSDFLISGGIKSPQCVKKIANMCPLVIYVKKGCPYCAKALSILADEGATPKIITLHGDNGRNTQNYLNVQTGRRTVPNVFIGGLSFGGSTEIENAHINGKLEQILKDSGVVLKKNKFSLF